MFVSKTESYISSVTSSNSAYGNIPALFTRPSILPYFLTVSSISDLHMSTQRISVSTKNALPPSRHICSSTFSPAVLLRPARTMQAPSPANTLAIPFPIPLVAPVTTMTLSCNRISQTPLLVSLSSFPSILKHP